jgi:hypothetical protein
MTLDLTVEPVPGRPALILGNYDLATLGFEVREYFVRGRATSYTERSAVGEDGRWDIAAAGTAEYTTRLVAVTPTDPAAYNGTVLVEWLNVSGGIDAPAVWMMAHREIIRAGYGYVAVSAQRVGVEGGDSLTGLDASLKAQHPTRYAPLHHPGDAYSFDIFTQIGRLVREQPATLGLAADADSLLALGESQSAMFLTTYINAIDPLAPVYDGFLVHSRFGTAAHIDGAPIRATDGVRTRFRPELRVPVVNVITETDLIDGLLPGYHRTRRPDDALLRTWEIAGAAHADTYTLTGSWIDDGRAPVADLAAAYAPVDMLMGTQLDHFINFAPQHHYVLQAALAGLHDWVRNGRPVPPAATLELTADTPPRLATDAHGIALGGVRTPWVEVPVAVTTGQIDTDAQMASIFGAGKPFDANALRQLYPGGQADYLQRFTTALDAAVAAGHLRPADRIEILEIAALTFAAAGVV